MVKKKKKVKKIKSRKVKAVKKVRAKPKAMGKAKPKAMRKVIRKKNNRKKAALILSIVAIAILVVNAIYYIAAKDSILSKVSETLDELPAEKLGGANVGEVMSFAQTSLIILAIIWIVLALVMVWTTFLLEKRKGKWYILLIIGILTFLTGRLGAGVLCIVSSILYKR